MAIVDAARLLDGKGVKHVLMSQVRRLGDLIRVSVRLIDAEDGKTLWAERYARP